MFVPERSERGPAADGAATGGSGNPPLAAIFSCLPSRRVNKGWPAKPPC